MKEGVPLKLRAQIIRCLVKKKGRTVCRQGENLLKIVVTLGVKWAPQKQSQRGEKKEQLLEAQTLQVVP